MSGDALHDLDGLTHRLQAVRESRTKLVTLRDRLADELQAKETEVKALDYEVDLLTKVGELFRVLMDQMVDRQVKIVEKVATDGLQRVFPDLGLSLESEVGPKYNKIAVDFFIRKGSGPMSHRGRPLESFGGGPSSVVSLILRVLTIKKLKRWPILVLDESLAAVSDDYIEYTGRFVRALAERLGFDILLVTHKQAFLEHAHMAYRGTEEQADGVTYLELRKVQ